MIRLGSKKQAWQHNLFGDFFCGFAGRGGGGGGGGPCETGFVSSFTYRFGWIKIGFGVYLNRSSPKMNPNSQKPDTS